MSRINPPKDSRYVVACPGTDPKKKTIRFVSRNKHVKLEDARAERDKWKAFTSGDTSIYKLTWGLNPEFIE